MGRGSSGARGGKAAKKAGIKLGARIDQITPPQRTLHSRSQVGELTKNYTPEMFMGDTRTWTGTVSDAKSLAEENMPKTLELGGYTFRSMGEPHAMYVTDGQLKNNTVVRMDYQSEEKIGNEYPVLQVGVRIRRFRGKIQTEIIRDHYEYGTKFW